MLSAGDMLQVADSPKILFKSVQALQTAFEEARPGDIIPEGYARLVYR
jgi:hypothetical protein